LYSCNQLKLQKLRCTCFFTFFAVDRRKKIQKCQLNKNMKNRRLIFFAGVFVLLSGCYPALQLINYIPSPKLQPISFEKETANAGFRFFYPDTTGDEYLRRLRTQYGLDTLVQKQGSPFGKLLAVLNWTHNQWEHSGNNHPEKPDPISILEEAKTGKQFRCVEYGIVSSAALKSVGIKARCLGLKTRDVEKVRHAAGHVVAEAYLGNPGKWVFLDAQMNVVPVLDGVPLNAVEFQSAVMNNKKNLKLVNIDGEVSEKDKEAYINFAAKYLYYFDFTFDQRVGENTRYEKIDGKTKLTLVPLGAKEPKIFQRNDSINYSLYTRSLADFYRIPE